MTPRYLAIVTEYANGGDLAQYMSQLPQARRGCTNSTVVDSTALYHAKLGCVSHAGATVTQLDHTCSSWRLGASIQRASAARG